MLSRTQGSTTIDYGYENSQWGDLLTSYRGRKIAYEGQSYDMFSDSVTGTPVSGNPVNYCGSNARRWEMTWKNGRYLSKVKSGGIIATYEYDKNGLRTSKTYNDTRYDYAYAGDKLVWQGWEGNEMYFFYDNTGAPIAFWYFPDGGSRITGYYFTNQQGDVVRIEDPDGNVLASYSYDAWGKAYKSSGSMRNINPLRFRGYYYDTETGFYYLQSRYYDPVVSRFINADSYASTGQGFLGYNMFAYCGNDPVSRVDADGNKYTMITDFGGGGKREPDTGEKIGKSIGAFVSSIHLSGGVGTGLYGKVVIDSLNVSGGAKYDILAFDYSPNKGFRVGRRGDADFSFSIAGSGNDLGQDLLGLFNMSFGDHEFTSYFGYGGCPRHPHSWCHCSNYEHTSGPSYFTGISGAAYFIAGGSFELGYDMNNFLEEIIKIWD